MTTPMSSPPRRSSPAATEEQLAAASAQGDAYRKALRAAAAPGNPMTVRAGDYVVALLSGDAEGMFAHTDTGLVWREASPDATAHLQVAVTDATDGRFVPGLDVHLDIERDARKLVTTALPFLWHPFLHHYGANASLPDDGRYDVTVRIGAAPYMRLDAANGARFAEPVAARFYRVRLAHGRRESPDAGPCGADAPTANG